MPRQGSLCFRPATFEHGEDSQPIHHKPIEAIEMPLTVADFEVVPPTTQDRVGDSEFQLRGSFKLCGLRYDGRGDVFGNRPFRPAGFKQPRDR